MSKKKWIIMIVVVSIIVLIGTAFIHQKLVESVHMSSSVADLSDTYRADKEINEAMSKLQGNPTPARIVQRGPNGHQVAVVFDGLPDRATTAKLIDVLKKYNAKAVFFVEGQNAANQPETIKLIKDAGMEIGNYTFIGIAHAEALSDEDLVGQLCKTQKVVSAMTDRTPSLVMAPKTNYSPNFLRVAGACGLNDAVQATILLPKNSLHTDADADTLVSSIKDGDIIAIPTGTPVDVLKMKTGKTDEKPAFDKKPTVKDNAASSSSKKETIVDETERLLKALQRLNFTMSFVV